LKKIDLAQDRAADFSARIKRDAAQIRNDFIVAPAASQPPAMTQLLRGGRGGGVVKLKVLLSMLWVAVAQPYDVTEPARVWAELIGLDDPESRGAARVNAAIRRLTEDKFLRVERQPGLPSRVFLMNETGNGDEYTKPSDYWGPGGVVGDLPRERYQYTSVPSDLWLNGWISGMSGPALAMYLAVLQQSNLKNGEPGRTGFYFAPNVAARRYGLTDVTRGKGLHELQDLGLIDIERKVIGRQALGNIRARNTYTVDMGRLRQKPSDSAFATLRR